MVELWLRLKLFLLLKITAVSPAAENKILSSSAKNKKIFPVPCRFYKNTADINSEGRKKHGLSTSEVHQCTHLFFHDILNPSKYNHVEIKNTTKAMIDRNCHCHLLY